MLSPQFIFDPFWRVFVWSRLISGHQDRIWVVSGHLALIGNCQLLTGLSRHCVYPLIFQPPPCYQPITAQRSLYIWVIFLFYFAFLSSSPYELSLQGMSKTDLYLIVSIWTKDEPTKETCCCWCYKTNPLLHHGSVLDFVGHLQA